MAEYKNWKFVLVISSVLIGYIIHQSYVLFYVIREISVSNISGILLKAVVLFFIFFKLKGVKELIKFYAILLVISDALRIFGSLLFLIANETARIKWGPTIFSFFTLTLGIYFYSYCDQAILYLNSNVNDRPDILDNVDADGNST